MRNAYNLALLISLGLGFCLTVSGCRSGSGSGKVRSQYCVTSRAGKSTSIGVFSALQNSDFSNGATKSLIKNDINELQHLNSTGPFILDRKYSSTFTSVFGGTQGSDVLQYFGDRIHYFVDKNDTVTLHPGHFIYNGWTTDPCDEQNLTSNDAGGSPSGRQNLASDPNVQIGAANIGTQLWLQGLIDRTAVSLELNGKHIEIDSSRVGLMMIGPAYKEFEVQGDGTKVLLPAPYRQQILVHEARHSDCTGGVTDQDLDIARTSKNEGEFFANFTKRPCGHLHVFCPKGSPFEGVAACDQDPWGAYAIGGVYALASTRNYADNDKNRQIMLMVAADAFSRLLYDAEGLLRGQYGRPDMSSSGLQQ